MLKLLPNAECEPDVATVEHLEHLLELAKSGKITGVATVYGSRNGNVTPEWVGTSPSFDGLRLIAGVHLLAHQMVVRLNDSLVDVED